MKNQSGTIKTNLELDRVVMGGSGGYRRLPGGSDHFSLQTNTQTDTHHNIYIIIIITIIILVEAIQKKCSGPRADIEDLTSKIQPVAIDNKFVIKSFRADSHSIRKDIHFRDPS